MNALFALGIVFGLLGLTIFLRWEYNVFGDPVGPLIFVVMFLFGDLVQSFLVRLGTIKVSTSGCAKTPQPINYCHSTCLLRVRLEYLAEASRHKAFLGYMNTQAVVPSIRDDGRRENNHASQIPENSRCNLKPKTAAVQHVHLCRRLSLQ